MDNNMTQEELLDYIIDKFNLSIDISTEQLELFIEQLFSKIITWELVTSILSVIIISALLITYSIFFIRKNKKEQIIKYIKEMWTRYEVSKDEEKKFIKYIIFIIIYIFVGIIALGILPSNIIDIIQCLVFPEKIILEFLGTYI